MLDMLFHLSNSSQVVSNQLLHGCSYFKCNTALEGAGSRSSIQQQGTAECCIGSFKTPTRVLLLRKYEIITILPPLIHPRKVQ